MNAPRHREPGGVTRYVTATPERQRGRWHGPCSTRGMTDDEYIDATMDRIRRGDRREPPANVALRMARQGVTSRQLAHVAGISRRHAAEVLLRLWLRDAVVVRRGPRGAHVYRTTDA